MATTGMHQRRSTPTAVSGAWPHCQHAAEPRPVAPTPRPPPGPLCSLIRPPRPVQWRHPVGVGRLAVQGDARRQVLHYLLARNTRGPIQRGALPWHPARYPPRVYPSPLHQQRLQRARRSHDGETDRCRQTDTGWQSRPEGTLWPSYRAPDTPPTTQGRWFISCKDIKAALHRAFKVWGKN